VFSFLQGLDHPVDHFYLGGAGLAPLRELPDQFGLPIRGHLAIARERRQHLLMPKVLAPRLELFRRPAQALAELGQCLAKGMRIGIGQPGAGEP
jgi:hypothetical protein